MALARMCNRLFSNAGGKWKCGVCMVQNDLDKYVCVACMTKKPASAAAGIVAVTTAAPKPAASNWGGLFSSSAQGMRLMTIF